MANVEGVKEAAAEIFEQSGCNCPICTGLKNAFGPKAKFDHKGGKSPEVHFAEIKTPEDLDFMLRKVFGGKEMAKKEEAEKVKRLSETKKYFAHTRKAAEDKIKEIIKKNDGVLTDNSVKQKVHKDTGTYYELIVKIEYNNSKDICDAGFFDK